MQGNVRKLFLPFLLSLTLMITLLVSVGFEATAQSGATETPTSSPEDRPNRNDPAVFYGEPAVATGDAEWTLGERTFESFYPNGFTFTIEASSSAGAIESATVVWSHAPRNITRRAAEFDEESGRFVATWPGIAEASIPPWVAVNYQWRFTDEAGNTYVSEWFTGEEYYITDEEWSRYESEDIIVFVEGTLPEETGQMTLDAMAAQRETYRQAWGSLLSNKPRAILFGSRDSWNRWRRGTENPNVIGQTSSEWGGIAQVVSRGGIEDLTYGTVLHEVGHLYQNEFAPSGFPAGTWWIEGNATFFELYQQYDYEQRVRDVAAAGQLPPLLDGSGPGATGRGPDGRGRFGYDVGYTFWKWIVMNYGLDAHRQIIEGVGRNRLRNEVLEEVLGMPIQEIESAWRVWLGASPTAPTLIPTPTIRIPPTVTPFGQ
ncbi:MAG: hypothetical protein CUN55_10725 [Phototrophicales bacterium]|nr:MAG: hypothetical protein CUN55_10725 [Phototrophicales bacterium]